jgi:hypothetical protein
MRSRTNPATPATHSSHPVPGSGAVKREKPMRFFTIATEDVSWATFNRAQPLMVQMTHA